MILNLSDVLSEQHKTIEQHIPLEMRTFTSAAGTYAIEPTEPVYICIRYAGNQKLDVSGSCSIKAKIPCDRCLEEVTEMIKLRFQRRVCIDGDLCRQEDETDENNYIDGYNLDVERLIYNELLVGWPTKVLCNKDCKGICNVCGQNLNEGVCSCEATNIDPRMSVIRDVFKNFKEV